MPTLPPSQSILLFELSTHSSSTREDIRNLMLKRRIGAYVGIDPTAPSLHLGHLVALMPLFWLYMNGYGAFTLIGHSTAKIGDPTGKTQDRPDLPPAELVQNLTGIHHQLGLLWKGVEIAARRLGLKRQWHWGRGIINNNHWWNKQPMLEVLRRLGSHVRMGPLLSRDNVKTRLGSGGSGMSFSEFAYPLLQGWDWWELYKQRGVQMQIGGSDQYSNIVIGAQCVKNCIGSQPSPIDRVPDAEMVGFTVPLLTTSSGKKFGKSEGNAVWLDPFRTSPYDMYGFLVRRPDDEVENLLKLLTFLPQDKIAKAVEDHKKDPPRRVAQHLLAFEVLEFVHGTEVANQTQIQHRQIYGSKSSTESSTSSWSSLQTEEQYQDLSRPRVDMKLPKSLIHGSFSRLVYAAALAESNGEADRLIKAGGMYVGGRPGETPSSPKNMGSDVLHFIPVKTWDASMVERFVIDGKMLILRKGKHNIRCIEFIEDRVFESSGMRYRGQRYLGRTRKALSILNDC